MSTNPPHIRTKPRRATQACDFCHRRGLKCKSASSQSGDGDGASCLTCLEHGQDCTRHRQPKKRGTKPRSGPLMQRLHDVNQTGSMYPLPPAAGARSGFAIGSRKIITALLDVYLDTIHPMFPIFCEREIWVGWRDGSFPADSSDYMSLMCMCALSAQHVGNGALFSDDVPTAEIASLAQEYLAEAIALVPLDFKAPCINQIRCYAFLALVGAQSGNNALAHKYLGLYHGLCAHYNLHDESQWPCAADACQTEVRRRLWWIMYRLEVHTACVHGSLIRLSEAQCHVGYPSGTHHAAFIPGRDGQFEDWFSGWNATTDLYRVLEHVIADFRTRRRPRLSILESDSRSSAISVAERLSRIQEEALPHFGSASSRSSDSGRNRCGFQASNILCTIHLARMISISGDSNFRSACKTAHDMITSMEAIPIEYIRAVGSPLLQQLAGVGHMLAGLACKHQLSEEEMNRFEHVMLAMIRFLSQLTDYSSTAATEERRLASRLAEASQRSRMTPRATSLDEIGVTNTGSPSITDDLDALFADLSYGRNFFSAHLARTLTWPYNMAVDDAAPSSETQSH